MPFLYCFRKCSSQNHHKADEGNVVNNVDHTVVDFHEEPNGTTSALIETILPLILPVIRAVISNQLLQDGCVLRDEIKVPFKQTESNPNSQPKKDKKIEDEFLPIGPIEINIGHIFIMDSKTVIEDMKLDSQFHWPEKDCVKELMKVVPGYGRKMIVMDFCDFQCQIPLGQGIELAFPLELPLMGSNVVLEVGSGKGVPDPWIKLKVPKMRIWFVTPTRKLYVAFMDRPQLIPNLHVNLDRGKGDFLDFVLKEDGSLDDVVETVLCSFGPKNFTSTTTTKDNNKKNIRGSTNSNRSNTMSQAIAPNSNGNKKMNTSTEVGTTSWVGNALGSIISRILLKSMSKTGERCPLEIDLSDMIQSSLDAVMGIPRPVDVIKADIARLERELKEATKASQQQQTNHHHQPKQQQQQQVVRGDDQTVNSKSSNGWSLF
jgi:hypothetical protein